MMPAYDEIYLSKAQIALAQMVRYAVNDLQYGIDRFLSYFFNPASRQTLPPGIIDIPLECQG